MLQDQNVQHLNCLRQHHVGKLADFLRLEVYKHYGKSPRDRHLTIDQMRADALSRAKEKRGIGGATLNRHLTFLGQIFHHAGSRGAEALSGIDLVKLRAKGKKQRARDERPKLAGRQPEISRLLGTPERSAGQSVAELIKELKLPQTLRDIGIKEEHFDVICKNSMVMLAHPATAGNQRPIGDEGEVRDILRSVY